MGRSSINRAPRRPARVPEYRTHQRLLALSPVTFARPETMEVLRQMRAAARARRKK